MTDESKAWGVDTAPQPRKKVRVTVTVEIEGPAEWVDRSAAGLVNAERPEWTTATNYGAKSGPGIIRLIGERKIDAL